MARTKRKVNPVLPVAVQAEQPRRIYQVGGYARLSVEDSGKPGADTITAQRELIQSYIDSQPDMQFCRSLEMGAIPMANGIIGRVSALHDIKIDDDHIADVIQGRPTILPDDVQETIRATVKSYAAGILDKLRELQVDLRATPAIFTGGGAALFRTFIETSSQVTKAEFVADPKANAVGFGMLATAQLRQMQAQKGGEGFAHG